MCRGWAAGQTIREEAMSADIQIRNKKFTRRRIIVILLLSVALIAAGWLFYLGLSLTELGGEIGLTPPLWLRESRYMEVMSEIADGRLAVGKPTAGPFTQVDYADFVVALPPCHENLTPHGIVLAEERSDGRWFVIFPTWHGFHHDMKGYLYCSEPLTSQDFELNTGWGVEVFVVCGQPLIVNRVRGPWYRIDGVPD
jgi:hypothetical protein